MKHALQIVFGCTGILILLLGLNTNPAKAQEIEKVNVQKVVVVNGEKTVIDTVVTAQEAEEMREEVAAMKRAGQRGQASGLVITRRDSSGNQVQVIQRGAGNRVRISQSGAGNQAKVHTEDIEVETQGKGHKQKVVIVINGDTLRNEVYAWPDTLVSYGMTWHDLDSLKQQSHYNIDSLFFLMPFGPRGFNDDFPGAEAIDSLIRQRMNRHPFFGRPDDFGWYEKSAPPRGDILWERKGPSRIYLQDIQAELAAPYYQHHLKGTVLLRNSTLEPLRLPKLEIEPQTNPNGLMLRFTLEEKADLSVQLYNRKGQLLFDDKVPTFKGEFSRTIPLQGGFTGDYILQVVHGSKSFTRKLVIR